MNAKQRLEYIKCGAKKPIIIKAIVQNNRIGWIEKFEVFSLETAEEDVLEIIKEQNIYNDEIISLVKII